MAATLRLEAELLGASSVGAAFSELLMRMGDLTPVMDEIGAAMVDSTRQRFADGVGPDGQSWSPSMRARLEGGQTLVDRRRLEGSLTHAPSRVEVSIGTNLVYAGIHQFGGRVQAKSARKMRFRVGGRWATKQAVEIPARPYLGISDADGNEIEAILADWLGDAF